MPKKPMPKPDDKEQSDRFIETARLLNANESGEEFELAMKIAKIAHLKKERDIKAKK